jgi:hypothetical protein
MALLGVRGSGPSPGQRALTVAHPGILDKPRPDTLMLY